jgi:hypothetical protein
MLCYVPGDMPQLVVILHPVGKSAAEERGWPLLLMETTVTDRNVGVTDAACVSRHHESFCHCHGT